MMAVAELAPVVGVQAACRNVGVSRASYYRAVSPAKASVPVVSPEAATPVAATDRVPHPRRLADTERHQVLDMLHFNLKQNHRNDETSQNGCTTHLLGKAPHIEKGIADIL